MKVLVDTNVILDFFLSREPFVTEAKQVFKMIRSKEVVACVSANSVTDIYYVISKRLHDEFARNAIRHILEAFAVIAVDGDDCGYALDLPMADFEDALIAVCAGKEDIQYIISNDKEFSQTNAKAAAVASSRDFLDLYKISNQRRNNNRQTQ